MTLASSLYEGWVTHSRARPAHHRFRYRVFSLLLDIDELGLLDRSQFLFAHNRGAVMSFHDKDHGDGRPLRDWVDDRLARAGLAAGGPIRLLCYPRLFGYVFNPLSVWFCHASNGELAAIIYEVHNTFGERHAYAMPAKGNRALVQHGCAKDFYVSPFLSMDCTYDFRIRPPGDDVRIAIRETESGAPVLTAIFSGKKKALTRFALASALLRYPLMTLKVVAAIHFEALRLWLKGVPHHGHDEASAPAKI
ncbi:MAG: DUF1365 domain-containing protein [Proteobacteria bacterium]|nr:DUF1365 domain-containing protein [Pseudomonadota bacterium]